MYSKSLCSYTSKKVIIMGCERSGLLFGSSSGYRCKSGTSTGAQKPSPGFSLYPAAFEQ